MSKAASTVEYAFLEHCLREDLNETAQRRMAVLRPVKLTLTNYPEGQSETFTVENNPNRPEDGSREVSFSRTLYVEAEDFLETPVPKYKRLYPDGPECRLKGAYVIQCTGCVKDADGNVVEILATYDPDSRGGDPADGRRWRPVWPGHRPPPPSSSSARATSAWTTGTPPRSIWCSTVR